MKAVPEGPPPRVVITGVEPEIEFGRFPIKRTVGERVVVEANIFADGHDELSCWLLHRPARPHTVGKRNPHSRAESAGSTPSLTLSRREGGDLGAPSPPLSRQEGGNLEADERLEWTRVAMAALGNDRWRAEFTVGDLGRHSYTLEGAVDHFRTWQHDLLKRLEAKQDVRVELQIGAQLLGEASERAEGEESERLRMVADALVGAASLRERTRLASDPALVVIAARYPEPPLTTRYERELEIVVDPPRAGFSAWYELFPRSTAGAGSRPTPLPRGEEARPGTFQDCVARLPYVASMGFDVVYLPPIHPIGHTKRKGKNGATASKPIDPGSPWAIGSDQGGHTSIHPELGTLDDFRQFLASAQEQGLEVALDVAFQCSPDHPWVHEHPDWFRVRPDGTVQYAENPPKKYEDIYPFNFETEDWPALWRALRDVFVFWIEQGVRIFRVDNPHTKPFAFWEWVIQELKTRYPDVILLSEAFTRPNVMYHLARIGFTQSYTYFAWRNASWEIRDYFRELTQTQVREYFRPNLWPNTPDILNAYLQTGGRPAFMTRLVLAATLGANYGIYGPAFELCESRPREPGSEEYLNSEKYEVRHWDLDTPQSLREFIALVNRIRRENRALQSNRGLIFHPIDNEAMICYSKQTDDRSNAILVVVVLDPLHRHSAWVDLDLGALGIEPEHPFQVHDLLTGGRYGWQGPRNYVELDPASVPAHVLRIEAPQT